MAWEVITLTLFSYPHPTISTTARIMNILTPFGRIVKDGGRLVDEDATDNQEAKKYVIRSAEGEPGSQRCFLLNLSRKSTGAA